MAETTIPVPSLIRFSVFEFDWQAGELRKKGARLRLEGQPLQVLALLLERPGQLVTREEIRGKLWPDDTFVDFEHSINTAVKKLRQVLDDSAEIPRFIETLPRRGYRFVYPIGKNGSEDPVASGPTVAHRPYAAVALVLGLLMVVATAIAAANFGRIRDRWFSRPSPINSLAVLPLENLTGDAEQGFLVDGIHDELITQMAQIGSLKVISRTSVLPYKQPSQRSAREIGEKLGVEALMEGTVQRTGTRLHLSLQLIHAPTDRHLWARSYDRDLREMLALQNEVVRDVAGAMRIPLSPQEEARLRNRAEVNPDVFKNCFKAAYQAQKWTKDSQYRAIEYYRQALDVDPTYAPAWVGMARAYMMLPEMGIPAEDTYPKAKAALLKALSLDETLWSAHHMLGAMAMLEWDWDGAEREFQRTRELNPAWTGPSRYLTVTGRFDEATAVAERDSRNDPLNYFTSLVLGWTYFMASRYDDSIAALRKTAELDPNASEPHFEMGWNYAMKGSFKEAIAECDTARNLLHQRKPDALVTSCGWVYAMAGDKSRAREMVRQIENKEGTSKGDKGLAHIYDALGDRDHAIHILQQLYRKHSSGLIGLAVSPMYSPQLRQDPRFAELVRLVGFPQYRTRLAAQARAR